MIFEVNATPPPTAEKLFSLLDLTSLGVDDDRETIARLCQQASVLLADQRCLNVAAICLYPEWIAHANCRSCIIPARLRWATTGMDQSLIKAWLRQVMRQRDNDDERAK